MVLPNDPALYLVPLALMTLVASFVQIRLNQTDLSKKKKEVEQKIYETLILREIGERIGYELSLEKILETITESLNKLLPYSVVSYILVSADRSKANLRFHLEESVSRNYLDAMRTFMLDALAKSIGHNIPIENISESITGTIVDEGQKEKIASMWLVPLTITSQNVGVLAISSKKPGLYKGEEMEVLNKIIAQADRAVSNLEKVLLTESEKLNSMVRAMGDGVLMLDSNLGILVINPAALKLLGLSSDQKVTILDVAEKLANKIDLRAKIDESISGDKIATAENLSVGESVSQLLISPVKDDAGKLLGTVVLFHDITAQKQLERIRDEFTAMMVHELRAPLTVVRGATEMFIKDPQIPTSQQGQDLLKTMQTSAGTMLSLVNDLLDASKIEAGKFQILKTKSDLAQVVNDRILFFTQMAMPKSIVISADGIESGLEADFDRERILQVLNNLLSNAVKFTPVGGKILVSAYKVADTHSIKWRYPQNTAVNFRVPSVVVGISDTGMGISPEQLPDLFSKFKQLKPSEHNGTGLGLVIAKGIIESHGGSMFVQSQVNEGTVFYFTLPF